MQREYVGLLIDIARRRIKQAVLSRVAERKLAPQQFWCLVGIREHPGITQAELVDRVRVDAPTASRILAALVRRRLVQTASDPRDRRRMLLSLTPGGDRLAKELSATAREVRDAVVAGMSDADVEALRRGLSRVIANMDRFEARASVRRTS